MERYEYEGCCGVNILANWNVEVKDAEKSQLKYAMEVVKRNKAFATVILDAYQTKVFGPALKKAGFKVKGTAVNPSSGNKLTLFVWAKPARKRR